MLKKILMVVVGLIALALIVPVFLPGGYTVERSIEIAKPPAVVFEQVVDFNKWLTWNPWTEMEPTAKNEITGPVAAVGSKWAWDGKELGKGSLTIQEVEKDHSVHSKLVIIAPMASTADDHMRLEATANGTKITWTNTGSLDYPLGRYVGLMIQGMLGPQYEKGLANLKRVTEAIPEPPPATEAPATEAKPEVKKSTSL